MRFYTNFFSRGNKIYVRGVQNGKRFSEVVDYKPYLFIASPNGNYSTLEGDPVEKIEFPSMSEARDFVSKYKDVSNFKFYGLTNYQYLYAYDEFPGEIDYDPKLVSIVSIDIETPTDQGFPDPHTAAAPISNITVSKNGIIVVFGFEYYKNERSDVRYVLCKDEKDMLSKFLTLMRHEDWAPDIITGWNIDRFDIPYLYNRIVLLLGESEAKKLSPWNMVQKREIVRGKGSGGSKDINDRTDLVYEIYGVITLDYLELYKKFSFSNQESYKLDYIAKVELDEQKLDYSEFNSLYDFYKKDYQRFVDYNIHDVVLVNRLDDKLKMIELVMTFAYDAKVNYNDVMTTVKPWDVIIHNYLLDQGKVIPQNTKHKMLESLVGGYVKEPMIGMHKWVVSFDLNSLYPHLIMQYNISPETFVGKIEFPSIDYMLEGHWEYRNSAVAYTANGCTYRKDKQGFLPALMEKMYDDRVAYKKKMLEAKQNYQKSKKPEDEKLIARYHNMQLAKKIQLSSAYGALGNEYFRWFSFNNAEAITTSGQLSIRWIEKKINEFLTKLLSRNADYIIASDTDSIYVNFGPLVEKVLKDKTDEEIVRALDEFVEAKIQPFINKCYEELADTMNAYKQKMQMKRETIANKGIWRKKKMYILNTWNVEGVQFDKPKLKMMGIEAVRSSTPMSCRDNIKKALEILMNENEVNLQRFIAEFRKEFMKLPFEDVAFPRGVKFNYYERAPNGGVYQMRYKLEDKSLPIQVKGSLLYNRMVDKLKLQKKYPHIQEGDKIRFAYLKMPNPVHESVFAVPDIMPPEFDLDRYVDREKQFEKAFLDPLEAITRIIGWQVEKKSTLEGFFS